MRYQKIKQLPPVQAQLHNMLKKSLKQFYIIFEQMVGLGVVLLCRFRFKVQCRV